MNTTKVQVYMLDTWAYSYELETRATVLATQIKMDMGQAREASLTYLDRYKETRVA